MCAINFLFFFPSVSGNSAGGGNLPDVAAAGSSAGGNVAGVAPAPNMHWIEAKTKKATLKLEKLDTELKNSKVRFIPGNFNIFFLCKLT